MRRSCFIVERAGPCNFPASKRQPTVAARQHAGDQVHQALPALIIECQHPIHRMSERILFIVRQRTRAASSYRGFAFSCRFKREPAPAVIGSCPAASRLNASMVSIRRREGCRSRSQPSLSM